MSDTAEERFAAGDPHGALAALQERVRAPRSERIDPGGDRFVGRGRRLIASSAGDHALLDCRTLRFETAGDGGAGG